MPTRRIRRRKPKLKLLALPGQQAKGSSLLNTEQLLARREEAMRLRLDEGMTYQQIADAQGTDRQTAHKDVQVITELKLKGMIEKDSMVLLENNVLYDKIKQIWMPLLEPLMSGKLLVGDIKTKPNGQTFDIFMPTFEAAKTATEMLLKTAAQREKLNGFVGYDSKAKLTPEDAGEVAVSIMKALYEHTSRPKTIKAEVVQDA